MIPPLTFAFYIGKQFLIWLGIAVLACGVVGLIGDLGETSRITSRGGNAGFLSVLQLTLFRFPNLIHELLPFAFLFGSIGFFTRLSNTNELVVARASGLSVWQFLSPSLIITLGIGLATITSWHPIAAFMSSKSVSVERQLSYGQTNDLRISPNGLWLREATDDGYRILHAPQITSTDPIILRQPLVMDFNESGDMINRLQAESAILQNAVWNLETVIRQDSAFQLSTSAAHSLTTGFDADQIKENFAAPLTISFWKLPYFIDVAEKAGFPTEQYQMYFHSLLALPFLLCAMVLIAATFGLHYSRMGGSGRLILMSVTSGLVLYFFTDLMKTLGGLGLLPPPLAAWAPCAIASFIGLTLLLHQEDG